MPDAGFHSFENLDDILFSVTFSVPVTLSGSGAAFLKVLVGNDEADAPLLEGSGTDVLMFSYGVGQGHLDDNGVSVPAGSLRYSAGTTLKGPYGQDAVLTHGAYGPFAGHLVNTPPPMPEITDIRIVSDVPDAGFYGAGTGADRIEFEVTFSAAVTFEATGGFIRLKLLVGETERVASAFAGSGTSKLLFGYNVLASDEDTDGVSVPAGSLALTGDGTLKGAVRPGRGADPRRVRVSATPREHPAAPGALHRHRGRVVAGQRRLLRDRGHHRAPRDIQRAGDHGRQRARHAPGRCAQAPGRRRREIR